MADSVYLFGMLVYTAFSLYLLYWLVSTLRAAKRNSAAAVAMLGKIDAGLSAVLKDLEGVHSRLDKLGASMEALETSKKAAAE
jgi:hypothetical protein